MFQRTEDDGTYPLHISCIIQRTSRNESIPSAYDLQIHPHPIQSPNKTWRCSNPTLRPDTHLHLKYICSCHLKPPSATWYLGGGGGGAQSMMHLCTAHALPLLPLTSPAFLLARQQADNHTKYTVHCFCFMLMCSCDDHAIINQSPDLGPSRS